MGGPCAIQAGERGVPESGQSDTLAPKRKLVACGTAHWLTIRGRSCTMFCNLSYRLPLANCPKLIA